LRGRFFERAIYSSEDLESAMQALRAGVSGYILKDITGLELINAIATVHNGESYINTDLAWRLVDWQSKVPRQAAKYGKSLTKREREVLDHICKGLSNQEIAGALGLSVNTIKAHKTLAFGKLGVRNRIEAVLAANKVGERKC
jgi:two-component system, NarL family, nitrate/nitrite response regulator NarL